MKKAIITAVLFSTVGVMAGPLGLSKGMTLEDAKKQGDFVSGSQQFVYAAKALKNGHPDFEGYTAIITPENGLCKLEAFSKDIIGSSFGTELNEKFKSIVGALTSKYGAPGKLFDFLKSGSIWNEEKDWMMGLLKKERYLVAFWASPENDNLPDSLKAIKVEAKALSGSKGYLVLGYEFDNVSECTRALNEKRNANL